MSVFCVILGVVGSDLLVVAYVGRFKSISTGTASMGTYDSINVHHLVLIEIVVQTRNNCCYEVDQYLAYIGFKRDS